MGFFANWKAKRADKAATATFNHLQLMWEEDVEQVKKLITVFTAASKGEDSVPNTLMQKPGEHTLICFSSFIFRTIQSLIALTVA